MPYLPKDFIETEEGLCFAVVQPGTERNNGQDKVLCFLRYIKGDPENSGTWRKVSTEQANVYLKDCYPEYHYHSVALDTHLHAVATDRIIQHHKPKDRLQQIIVAQQRYKVEQDLYNLCSLFQQNSLDLSQVGVTGSILLGAQQESSDIDLVIYDRENFYKARAITAELINAQQLGDLSTKDWQEAYARRSCALSLQEYVWHEQRKSNKAIINGRKFDLNFVDGQCIFEPVANHKLGPITVRCKITEDWHGFDYPAIYSINHKEIHSVACFIATYTGQAVIGETVEISGLLEQAEDGTKRIVVGSSREAPGEYIKVIECHN
jgi:predicted nucleotidyltransferase